MNSWGPKAFLEKDGAVTGVELKRCTRVFDEERRFNPAYDESVTTTVEVDNVILGIGQRSDLGFLTDTPVALDRGRLVCERVSLTTSERGVFACGEVITGPGSAIAAIGTGHEAAKVISHFLETGEKLRLPQQAITTIGELPAATAARAKRFERVEVHLMDAEERIKDFSPIEPGYSEAEALLEARRCIACATGAQLKFPAHCAACQTCVRVCPFDVARVEKEAVMPAQQCQTCGLCAAECPAAAIELTRFSTNGMTNTLKSVLSDAEKAARPFLVSYCCLNETTSRKFLMPQTEGEIRQSAILRVMIPCVARLSAVEMLHPFELGADRVAVIACNEDGCFYTGAEELLGRRVNRVKKILDEIGVGQDKLQLFKTSGSAEECWPGIWEQLRKE